MPFFTFNQNNSGGNWVYDEYDGISVHVVVEASDAYTANQRAQRIGLYFDHSMDCSCCGGRWYETDDSDGKDTPQVYGREVSKDCLLPAKDEIGFGLSFKWMEGYEGFIHYENGDLHGFWKEQAERTDLGKHGFGVRFNRWQASEPFLVGKNGYDETGNMKAAPRKGKSNVEVSDYHGDRYGAAWFADEADAQQFVNEFNTLGTHIRTMNNEFVESMIKQHRKSKVAEALEVFIYGEVE